LIICTSNKSQIRFAAIITSSERGPSLAFCNYNIQGDNNEKILYI
jgi:hypothetical protein